LLLETELGAYQTKLTKTVLTVVCLKMTLTYFFHFNFPRAVWFSSRTLFKSTLLPQEHNGVQAALQVPIMPQTSDHTMLLTVTTLWYIWKARNELRFRKQKWSVLQVHYAVQAHIKTNILSISREEKQQLTSQTGSDSLVFAGCQNGTSTFRQGD
jgi:hypothetical protein